MEGRGTGVLVLMSDNIEDHFFDEDDFDDEVIDDTTTWREWLSRDWKRYFLIPCIPFLYFIGFSMMFGQYITGDRPTGAFPTGLMGAMFGVTLGSLALVGTIMLVFFNV